MQDAKGVQEAPILNRANIRVPPLLLPPSWTNASAGAVAGMIGRWVGSTTASMKKAGN